MAWTAKLEAGERLMAMEWPVPLGSRGGDYRIRKGQGTADVGAV
jgi:hypothetical protein